MQKLSRIKSPALKRAVIGLGLITAFGAGYQLNEANGLEIAREINKRLEHPVEIPVLYITQALGLAVGLSPQQLGLSRHFVPVNIF